MRQLPSESHSVSVSWMTWRDVLTYLDDINVLGRSFEDHLQNLHKVFERLKKQSETEA